MARHAPDWKLKEYRKSKMSNPNPNKPTSQSRTYKHIAVEGMSCAACASGVKRILEKQPGIQSADIQLANHTARIGYDPDAVDWEAIGHKLQSAGYSLVQSESDAESTAAELLHSELKKLSHHTLMAAVLGLPLMAVGMLWMHTEWARWLMPALATPIMLIPGRQFFVKAVGQFRIGTWGMDSLVALSCTTAFAYSLWNTLFPHLQRQQGLEPHVYYEGIGAIIGFLLLGRWLEGKARLKATQGIGELFSDQPAVALCWRNEAWTGVAVASLNLGDRVLVQAGARIPVDGRVAAGSAEVDESWISGEPFPVSRGVGDEVCAGSQTTSGSMEVVVSRRGSETLQGQIHQQIREAQAARAPIQDRVDQITQWFVPGVLALAFLSAVIWSISGAENALSLGLLAFVNTLIIACPCAMGLATPTALVAGVSKAARLGVLVRDASVWEKAGAIDILLCDKTGTLTAGCPIVRSIRWNPTLTPIRRRALLNLWQSASQHSTHPVARSLTQFKGTSVDNHIGSAVSSQNNPPPLHITDTEEYVGLGLSFCHQKTEYRSGRLSFVRNEATTSVQSDRYDHSAYDSIHTDQCDSSREITPADLKESSHQNNPSDQKHSSREIIHTDPKESSHQNNPSNQNSTTRDPSSSDSTDSTLGAFPLVTHRPSDAVDSTPELDSPQGTDDWSDYIQNQAPASAELWFAANGTILACALVDDPLRTDAREFVCHLKNRGIQMMIISGDGRARVASLAQEVGVQEYKGNLLPSDKLAEVHAWQSKRKVVAMLGDGLNDAGALAAANLSIAMGTGSALSKHQSGLVVTRNELSALTTFFDLAARTHRILRQNLVWAFAYNVIGIPVAMGLLYPFFEILLHPSLAAAAMAISSVSVVGNSIRLLKK
ncbi:MAG: heavy metal translocating P-type ATPase [Sphingomonadales bacterium]|nr:heavy metal translocating P-type ATPase [Sphingomonadales bacterium]